MTTDPPPACLPAPALTRGRARLKALDVTDTSRDFGAERSTWERRDDTVVVGGWATAAAREEKGMSGFSDPKPLNLKRKGVRVPAYLWPRRSDAVSTANESVARC